MNGFTSECTEVIQKAGEFASKSGGLMGTEHIICGMLACKDSNAGKILANFGLNEKAISQMIEQGLRTGL